MSVELLPVSAVIATRNRAIALEKTLQSLGSQSALPIEILVIDSSDNAESESVCKKAFMAFGSRVKWRAAAKAGAATQRNEGVANATQPFIWFFDDDILFEPNSVGRLWEALQ